MATPETSKPFKDAVTRLYNALYAGVHSRSPIEISVSEKQPKWVEIDTSKPFARTFRALVKDIYLENNFPGDVTRTPGHNGITISYSMDARHEPQIIQRLNDLAALVESNKTFAQDYTFAAANLDITERIDGEKPYIALGIERALVGDPKATRFVVVENFSETNWERIKDSLKGIAIYQRRWLGDNAQLRVDVNDLGNLERLKAALESTREAVKGG